MRATLAAGDLRHRITIVDPTATVTGQDSFGGPSVSTAPAVIADNIPAKVTFVSGKQVYAGQQLVSQVTHEVAIRYMNGVKVRQNVLWEGRTLEITSADPDVRKVWLFLSCLERES